jgi:hypothetical protein
MRESADPLPFRAALDDCQIRAAQTRALPAIAAPVTRRRA